MVTQPFDGVLPPHQNSIGLIVYNTAVELSANADVTIYLKNQPDAKASTDLPFHVQKIETPWDDRLEGFATRYPRWSRRFGIGTKISEYDGCARSTRSRKPLKDGSTAPWKIWPATVS